MEPTTLTTRQLNRATLARQLLRVAAFSEPALQQALHDRSVVRATLMRGTLHLATATDYADFRAPLQPVLTRGMTGALRERAEGLEPDAVLPVARALLEERPRAFDELRTLLQEAFPAVNHRALGYAVRMLLPLVMVPTDDRWAFPRVAQFTLADSWLGRALSAEEAPDGLVLRYLAAFGPAPGHQGRARGSAPAPGHVHRRAWS